MARKQSKFIIQQKIALGVFGALILGIVGFLLWQSTSSPTSDAITEGEHYLLVEEPRRIRSGKIEIMEFFSYGCVHCYNFEPILTDWVAEKGDAINFVRMPAIANDYWRLLGRAYFTLEAMDVMEEQHMDLFRAIHDGRKVFNSEEELIDFFVSNGLDRATFTTTFNSPAVASSISRADLMARRLRVAAVPTVVVQGKYIVRTTSSQGPRQMLAVMDYLIDREQAEQKVQAGSAPDA